MLSELRPMGSHLTVFDVRCDCGQLATLRQPPWDSDLVVVDCARCHGTFESQFAWRRRGEFGQWVPVTWQRVSPSGPYELAGAFHDITARVTPRAVQVTVRRVSDGRVEFDHALPRHRVLDNLRSWYLGWYPLKGVARRRVRGRHLEAFVSGLLDEQVLDGLEKV